MTMETLTAIARAGADILITYHGRDVLRAAVALRGRDEGTTT